MQNQNCPDEDQKIENPWDVRNYCSVTSAERQRCVNKTSKILCHGVKTTRENLHNHKKDFTIEDFLKQGFFPGNIYG